MVEFKNNDFSISAIKAFLADRFEKTDTRDPNNMTKRVDKYSSMFNALTKKGALAGIKTFSELNEKLDDILDKGYNTASSRQSALSMFRIIFVGVGGMSEADTNERFKQKNIDLTTEYIKTTSEKKPVGMSFAEAKAIHNENPHIELYFKLMSGVMPILRIGDWINTTTEDDGKHNYLNLKKREMTRRITKNNKGELTFRIPVSIINEVKKQNIKGYLFGDLDEHKLVDLVKRAYKDKIVNPHHFRVLYATEKVLKMRSAEKIIDSLDVSDHSLKTFLTIYERSGKPAIKALKKLLLK
jgi:hypothetical protein